MLWSEIENIVVSVKEIRKITPTYSGGHFVDLSHGYVYLFFIYFYVYLFFIYLKTRLPTKCPLPSYVTCHQHIPDMSHLTQKKYSAVEMITEL